MVHFPVTNQLCSTSSAKSERKSLMLLCYYLFSPSLSSIPPQTLVAGRLLFRQSPAERVPGLLQDFGSLTGYSWEACLGCCSTQVDLDSQSGCCEDRLTESQNGLGWNGPLRATSFQPPCTGIPSTSSACSVMCPAWPWMFPRTEHSPLLMAPLQPGQCLIWSFTSGQDAASFVAPWEFSRCDRGLLRPPQILEKLIFLSVI